MSLYLLNMRQDELNISNNEVLGGMNVATAGLGVRGAPRKAAVTAHMETMSPALHCLLPDPSTARSVVIVTKKWLELRGGKRRD